MFPSRVTDLQRASAPPPAGTAPRATFADPPACPRCELVEHQSQLKLNTYQKVYKKKLNEAQDESGRWRSEYYRVQQELYNVKKSRTLLNQVPAVALGCAVGILITKLPVPPSLPWLQPRRWLQHVQRMLQNKRQAVSAKASSTERQENGAAAAAASAATPGADTDAVDGVGADAVLSPSSTPSSQPSSRVSAPTELQMSPLANERSTSALSDPQSHSEGREAAASEHGIAGTASTAGTAGTAEQAPAPVEASAAVPEDEPLGSVASEPQTSSFQPELQMV